MNNKLWQKYPKLQKQLNLTANRIEHELTILDRGGHHDLFEMTRKIALGTGKMIRPALVFLFNELGPKPAPDSDVVTVAGSMEILHLATLIHDDVIDNSTLRRHETTLNQKYGMRNAVYAGDYLFTIFFELQTRSELSKEAIHENSLAMKQILFGELDQMKSNWNFDVTYDQYLAEVTGKTAALFAISCQNGIELGQGSKEQQRDAYNFGLNLGIAFQMMDDLLDFKRIDDTGKQNFLDIKNGVFSLPYIMAFQGPKAKKLKELIDNFDETKEDQVIELVTQNGGFDKTKAKIHEYIGLAEQELSKFNDNSTRKVLNKVLEKMFQQL